MTDWDTKRAAIGLAVAATGSLSRAAANFGVAVADLKAWLDGSAEVPKSAFYSAVEYLLSIRHADLGAARKIVERSEFPAMTDTLEVLLDRRRK